jgi:biopolymer transport protein ExbD
MAKVDLTPMLDVVFILLIFFIVTAVFIQESAIDLETPPSGGTGIPQPTIIVSVNEEGTIRVNGRASLVESVRANIERLRAETPQSAVIIQAHPEASNKIVLRIRDQLASARVDSVNLVLSDV